MASLFSLDGKGAFNYVAYIRLLHNIRKRRVPILLLYWIADFLEERRTILAIGGFTLEERTANVGIPQGSPLSLILYLFYNADLLEICDNIRLRTSATGFVDDDNILIYSELTEENCKKLSKVYEKCEE